MKYRGFVIKATTRKVHGISQQGFGIFVNDNLLTMTENTLLAKKHIDDRVKRGIWKEIQGGEHE